MFRPSRFHGRTRELLSLAILSLLRKHSNKQTFSCKGRESWNAGLTNTWSLLVRPVINVSALTDAYVDKRVAGKKGAMLLNGKLLSLTILKTGLCTKGYVIGSMEKSNLQRHPIMLVRLFSLMAIHVKPCNWLTNSRPVRKITRLWKN